MHKAGSDTEEGKSMANIIARDDAETVHFSPPVVDNESSEPHRDRQALAGVIEEGRIAELDDGPLADEEPQGPGEPETRLAGLHGPGAGIIEQPLASESRSALERVRFCH